MYLQPEESQALCSCLPTMLQGLQLLQRAALKGSRNGSAVRTAESGAQPSGCGGVCIFCLFLQFASLKTHA